MSLAACVRDGDSTVYCCTSSPDDFSIAVRVSRLQVAATGASASVTTHTHSWCLHSPVIHVTPATWGGRPHAVVLTADAHLWVLCLDRVLSLPQSSPPSPYQLQTRAELDTGCTWLRCDTAAEAGGDADVPPRVDSESVSWPAAVVPLASCCVVAGDELVVAHAHATPAVLLLADVACTPRLGRLQLLVGDDNNRSAPLTQPRCCACVALPASHGGPCSAAGWIQLSAPFARALRLQHSSGAHPAVAVVGQRRPRSTIDPDGGNLQCGCMKWVLVGNADGTVHSHTCNSSGDARGCGRPVVLFHLHEPCVNIAVLAPDALLLVGASGRVVVARLAGTTALHMDDLSVPCAAVTGACIVPHTTRVAVACDTGVLLSSPLLGTSTPPRDPAWEPVLSSAHAIHDVASVTCAGCVCLLASTRDGDVISVTVPNNRDSAPPAIDSGPTLSDSASQRFAAALAQLQAALASRAALVAQHQAADTVLADLTGALTVAGAIAAAPTCDPDGSVRVALDARQTVASGILCLVRDHSHHIYTSSILIHTRTLALSPYQDVTNHSSRDITRSWHLAVTVHVRPVGSAPAVWACAPLSGGVPAMGGTRRVTIPLPDAAPCGVPLGAGTHDVTAWLVHAQLHCGQPPTALCVLQTTIDVMHAAQPEPHGRPASAANGAATAAAASRVVRSVRMSVPEQVTPGQCLRVACGAEESTAGAWPPGDGVVRAAVPPLQAKHPGVAVRVLACRNGVAHLTLTAPSDTSMVPWVRHFLQWAVCLRLRAVTDAHHTQLAISAGT